MILYPDHYISSYMILYLVGGFNPFQKYQSNWIISPGKGENPPTRVGVWWKYLMQDPNGCRSILIQSQNPKSKIQTGPFGAATRRTKTKLIQNPKSKLQNPRSKIQNPKSKIQDPKSQIQNPRSKIQNPNSKIQTARQKRLIFEECSMCIKLRKYRQKWPLGRASLGQGAESPKS